MSLANYMRDHKVFTSKIYISHWRAHTCLISPMMLSSGVHTPVVSPQLTVFFTSAPIFAFTSAANSFSAEAVGHLAPSSKTTVSLNLPRSPTSFWTYAYFGGSIRPCCPWHRRASRSGFLARGLAHQRNAKIVKYGSIVEHTKLAVADLLDILGQSGQTQACEEWCFRRSTGEILLFLFKNS